MRPTDLKKAFITLVAVAAASASTACSNDDSEGDATAQAIVGSGTRVPARTVCNGEQSSITVNIERDEGRAPKRLTGTYSATYGRACSTSTNALFDHAGTFSADISRIVKVGPNRIRIEVTGAQAMQLHKKTWYSDSEIARSCESAKGSVTVTELPFTFGQLELYSDPTPVVGVDGPARGYISLETPELTAPGGPYTWDSISARAECASGNDTYYLVEALLPYAE